MEGGAAAAVQKKHPGTAADVAEGHGTVAGGEDGDGELPGLVYRMV